MEFQSFNSKKIFRLLFLVLLLQFSCKSAEKEEHSFESYLKHFQAIETPVEILSGDTTRLNHVKEIDSFFVKRFILPERFGNEDYNPAAAVYYYGALTLSDQFTSVIIYQFYPEEAFSHFYFLINYDHDGTIISTKTLAGRSDAPTWFNLDAKLERGHLDLNERASYRDLQDNPGEIHYTYSFNISHDRHFEPVPFRKKLLTDWDKLVKHGNNFVVEEVEFSFGNGHEKLHFIKEENNYTLEYDLVSHTILYNIVAFKESKEEYVLVVKRVDDPLNREEELHFRYVSMEEQITLWNANENLSFPTLYFTTHEAVSNFNVEYGESEGGGVSIPLDVLISEKGVGKILLSNKLELLKEFYPADKIRMETEESEDSSIDVVTVYDDTKKAILTIVPDEQKKNVFRILVYGKFFKTEENIGVGNTYAELVNAYKSVSVMGGEDGVLVAVDELPNVLFMLDSESLSWVPDQQIEVQGNTKILYIILTSRE